MPEPSASLPGLENVRLEPDGDAVWIVLDRPAVLNALSRGMQRDLLTAIGAVGAGDWRCVLLRGEGRGFCSGADLRSFQDDVDPDDPASVSAHMDRWNAVVAGLRALDVPVVAAVHGPAYGGGWSLALAADLVVAAASARFCMSYVDRGVPADLGASYLLPRLAGLGAARRLLLLGEVVTAEEALRLGLCAAVVEDAQLLPAARATAAQLAAKPPRALQALRALLDVNLDASFADALRREGDAVTAAVDDPAFRAASTRFRSEAGR